MENKKKKIIIASVFVLLLVVGISFAIVVRTLSGTKQYSLLSSDLQLYLDESQNLTDVIESNLRIPVEDFEGKLTTGYQFSLINKGGSSADYTIYLDEDDANTMPAYALRYNLVGDTEKIDITGNIERR